MNKKSIFLFILCITLLVGSLSSQIIKPDVTSLSSGFVSCDGSGGTLYIKSDFQFETTSAGQNIIIDYDLADPGIDPIYHNRTVWIMGEKLNNNNLFPIPFSGSQVNYTAPSSDFTNGAIIALDIPQDIVSIFICISQNYDYDPAQQQTQQNAYSTSNSTFKLNIWNDDPNFSVLGTNISQCVDYSGILQAQYTPTNWTTPTIYHYNTAIHPKPIIHWYEDFLFIGSGLTLNYSTTSSVTISAAIFPGTTPCLSLLNTQLDISILDNPTTNIVTTDACDGNIGSVTVDLVNYSNWNWTPINITLTNGVTTIQPSISISGLTAYFNNVSGPNYQLIIDRPSGCSQFVSDPFTINSGISPTVSANIVNPTCYGALSSIFLTVSNPGYPYNTYNWSDGTNQLSIIGPNAINIGAGVFEVEVVSATGCGITLNNLVTLPAPSSPVSFTLFPSNAQCLGVDGNVGVQASGGISPYSFSFSNGASVNGQTSATVSMPIGNYSFTITDANNCQSSGSGSIMNQNLWPFPIAETIIDAPCIGVGNGLITLSPGYGTNNMYDYSWSNSETDPSLHAPVGTYSVTATVASQLPAPNDQILVGCQVVETYAIESNTPSEWHKSSNNVSGNDDRIVKVLTDPLTNEVYILGEFTGKTEMGYDFGAGMSNSEGIFIIKYDECGQSVWGAYSKLLPTSTTPLSIKAIDLQFNGSSIRVYGQWDNVSGNIDFNMKSTSATLNSLGINGVSGHNVFSIDINSTGALSSASTYELNYPIFSNNILISGDSITQVILDGTKTYFAGVFENASSTLHAGVRLLNGTNWTDPILDSEEGNSISAIVIDNSDIYAIGNMINAFDFGPGQLSPNGSQEGVILKYDASLTTNLVSQHQANATDFVSVNDILLDGGNLWVALEYNMTLDNWSNLSSNVNTAMVVQFDTDLHPLQSFNIDENSTSGLQAASAKSISMVNHKLFVAGTFIGQDLTIGNANNITPNSIISGSTITTDLWMAKYDDVSGSFLWIEGSNSPAEVEVTDIEYDGSNAYLAGSFLDNMDFQNSIINLDHPNPQHFNSAFVVRGGDLLSGGSQGQYYKTNGLISNPTEEPQEIVNESEFKLYPNPNNGSFSINYISEFTGNLRIEINDITGRLVFFQTFEKSSTLMNQTISHTQLTNGVYMLSMSINGNTQYKKFIIQ